MILTKIIVSSASNISLIAIEEPENSVHPGLLQAYMQIISQLLDDCKVIITSHSPYIISYLEPSWIICLKSMILEKFKLASRWRRMRIKKWGLLKMGM